MNYKRIICGICAGLIILFASACTASKAPNPPLQNNEQSLKQGKENKIQAQITPPASGPVMAVPWENDSQFRNALAKVGATVRMAAFCTVLKDPLPGEEYNVHLAASLLKGTVVEPGKVFSQNGTIGPYSYERGFQDGPVYLGTQLSKVVGGGVCKMASTLYNAAILGNLEIVERHAHNMPVPYVPYGQDATVSFGTRDFKFMNNSGHPILIWAQGVENRLFVAFYGGNTPPKIEWHHEIFDKVKAPVLYKENSALPAGTQKTSVEGMDGAQVRSWVMVIKNDGTRYRRDLFNSSYSPLPFVIEKG